MSGATTDGKGNFGLTGLMPGVYYWKASRSGYLETYFGSLRADVLAENLRDLVDRSVGRKLKVNVPTFYPGTTEPSAAMGVSVAAGVKMTAIDLTPVQTRVDRMGGAVSTETTVPRVTAQLVRGELDGLWDVPAVVAVKEGTDGGEQRVPDGDACGCGRGGCGRPAGGNGCSG